MNTSGPEFDKFVVEPWMDLEPLPLFKIKKIFLDNPYKILLQYIYKFCPSYNLMKKIFIMKTSLNFTSEFWMIIIDIELLLIAIPNFFLIINYVYSKIKNMVNPFIIWLIIGMIKKFYYLIM